MFMAALLAHELAHSLVARHFGVPVTSITLWALGGISELLREPPTARADLRIAVVGPVTSLGAGDEDGRRDRRSAGRDPRPYFPRPGDQRTVISHASHAARPQTPEEAAAELVLLDYDFHLFTERSTGQDSLIYRTPGGYRLAMAHPKPSRLGPLPGSVTVSPLPAPRLTVREASERLDESGQPFTFFLDARTGRGSIVYHRYDGHYGLLVPAGVLRCLGPPG
jgi:hypothetical protein